MNRYENEYSRKNDIEKMLTQAGWDINDPSQVESNYRIKNANTIMEADYVLLGNDRRPLAVIEVKRDGTDQYNAKGQVLSYAHSLNTPFVFYTIGNSIYFWDILMDDAHMINSFYSRDDLERILYLRNKKVPLSYNNGMIIPRYYQEEIVKTLIDTVNSGKKRSLIELATGLGKTYIALIFIEKLIITNNARKFLFLVENTNIALQVEQRILETFSGLCKVCLLKSDYNLYENFSLNENLIIISTFQTMSNQYERLTSGYFDIVITHECSSIEKRNWYVVLNHFDAFHIGFSSIPVSLLDPIVWKFYGSTDISGIDYKYSFSNAINEGFLVPVRLYSINYNKQLKSSSQLLDIDDILNAEQNSQKMMLELDKLMFQNYNELADSVSIAPGKGLVFASSKVQAMTLANYLNKLHPEYNGNYADIITSDISDVSKIMDNFKNNELPLVLININMLTTGFDFPELLHIAICKNIKSPAQYYQILSRGMRKSAKIAKREFAVYDFTNSFQYVENQYGVYKQMDISFNDLEFREDEDKFDNSNLFIVTGSKGKLISKKKYISKWVKTVKDEAKHDEAVQKIMNGFLLTDEESQSLNDKFSQMDWRFNEENLGLAYDKQGDTIEQFIRVALGKFNYKSKEKELEDKFIVWLVSKNVSPEQSQYLHILKNIGLKRGNLNTGILLEPQFLILNLIDIGKDLFGEAGFDEIINDINQIICES